MKLFANLIREQKQTRLTFMTLHITYDALYQKVTIRLIKKFTYSQKPVYKFTSQLYHNRFICVSCSIMIY